MLVNIVVSWTGVEARALRLATRMTVETFAERLGAGVRTVANWESRGASISPQPDMQAALDTLLARASADVHDRFRLMIEAVPRQRDEATYSSARPRWGEGRSPGNHPGDGAGGRQDATSAAGSVALTRIPFLPAVVERTALDWLIEAQTSARDPVRGAHPAGVDQGEVESAAAALQRFRSLDHAHGSGHVHGKVEQFIADQLGPMIDSDAASRGRGVRLHTLAVGFYEFSGYQAVDTGADGLAQRRYLRALQLSQVIQDRTYGAYLLAVSLGHLALHCNHPEAALRAALAAAAGSGTAASPAVRAALHAVVARAHARAGRVRECTAELLAAESMLQRSDPDDEPAWIRYFTSAYLADEMAHCFADLGDHSEARRCVDTALASLQPGHLRRLTIDTALLASSLPGRDTSTRPARLAVLRSITRRVPRRSAASSASWAYGSSSRPVVTSET